MSDSTSAPHPAPVPPGTPTRKESEDREKFQAAHTEVGFAFQPRCEEGPWIAYWLAAEDGKPRHVTGATLGDVLDIVEPLFI